MVVEIQYSKKWQQLYIYTIKHTAKDGIKLRMLIRSVKHIRSPHRKRLVVDRVLETRRFLTIQYRFALFGRVFALINNMLTINIMSQVLLVIYLLVAISTGLSKCGEITSQQRSYINIIPKRNCGHKLLLISNILIVE